MKAYRVVIVDDEKLARDSARMLLTNLDDWELVGEASNGLEALQLISETNPDLVLMDVEMPIRSGFEALKELERRPHIIFITAFDSFAIQAFDENAVDYLLKPYTDERFIQALAKAKLIIEQKEAQSKLDQVSRLLDSRPQSAQAYLERISVTVGDRIIVIDLKEVIWISASGNYVELHTLNMKYLHYSGISDLEKKLDSTQFIRINRSYIVGRAHIKGLRKHLNGEYFVMMVSGEELKLSRSYKRKAKTLLR